jgi:CO/xanthine dehydrogenase FAD-binding subunit
LYRLHVERVHVAVAYDSLALERPRSLRAALRMLADDPSLTPLAGGTDIYVGLQFGTITGKRFIDVWRLDELAGIRIEDGTLRIGALATYTEIIRSRAVQQRLPMLAAAAREIGGAQIQNRGTLGGNIANASPAGDTLPVLMAANATVVLQSVRGVRRVPFETFYTGYRTSVRRNDELIVAVEVPRLDGRQWWRKVGTRRAQAISKVMIAAVRGGTTRIAFGSVAPTVVLVRQSTDVLTAGGTMADAQAALRREIAPIDDVRSTGEYRRTVAANLLEQFWRETRTGGKEEGNRRKEKTSISLIESQS